MTEPTNEQIRAAVRELSLSLSDASEHLSDDDVQRVVRRQLSPSEQAIADEHLRNCDICARAVDELRQWAAPAKTTGYGWMALAAAVLLAVIVPAALWWHGVNPAGGRAATVAASLDGLDALDPADRARVTAALDAGVASPPAVLNDLRPARDVTLGQAAPQPAFDVAAPVGTVVLSDRPQFTWQPLAGAGSYVVTVFDEAAHVVQRGDAVQKTTWTPSRALPRETTLVWQVEAHRGQDTVTAPLSPARPAKFRVLDAASAERLAGVEASYPRSHVMLGILFAEAGVVDAAETHFEQVSPGDPHGAVARETLARLHSPSR